jgi:hypothetical protein
MSDGILSHEIQKLRDDVDFNFNFLKNVIRNVDQKVGRLVPLLPETDASIFNCTEVVQEYTKARILQLALNNYQTKFVSLLPDELKGAVRSFRLSIYLLYKFCIQLQLFK